MRDNESDAVTVTVVLILCGLAFIAGYMFKAYEGRMDRGAAVQVEQ